MPIYPAIFMAGSTIVAAGIPYIRASTITPFTSSADPVDLNTSAHGWASGDYAIAVFATSGTNTLTSVAGQDATGADTYTSIDSSSIAGARLFVQEGTITSPFDAVTRFDQSSALRAVAGVIAIDDAAANANQPDVAPTKTQGSDSTPVNPSVTTVTNNCLVLGLVAIRGSHNLATIAQPAGWTLLGSWRSHTATDVANTVYETMAIAYKTQTTAGATGAGTWSGFGGTTNPWSSITLPVRPA